VRRGYRGGVLDVLLIALAIGFFLVADLFVRGCARILDRGTDEQRENGR
jgi:hypothetical protein